MYKGSKLSGDRNRKRLKKNDYEKLKGTNSSSNKDTEEDTEEEFYNMYFFREKSKGCHKKKNGPPYEERPKDAYTHCACCNIYLGPAEEIWSRPEVNCCYDCGFRSYCDQCCFTWISDDINDPNKIFRTCGKGFMKQLLNKNYQRGRYSMMTQNIEDIEIMNYLRIHFKNEMKYGMHPDTMRGKVVDAEDIKKKMKELQK